jgi:iron complex outermembrane receptor protein
MTCSLWPVPIPTWELGARSQRAALAWEVTAYRAGWTDEILRLADARGAALGAINASPTRHEGIEASARWRVLDGPPRLTLSSTAVWNNFFFTGDPVLGRNRLAGVPAFLGSAELLLETPRGFFCALGADRTNDRIPVDHGGRMTYAGRTLAHARAGWRAGAAWTLFVDVRNVFDRAYLASTAGVPDLVRNPAATAIFLPGPGRSLTLGLEWKR